MKVKKLLAGFLSAAMVLGTMSFPVFAANETYTVDAENTLERVMSEINASASGNVVINLDTDATLQLPDYYANLVNDDVKSLTINGNNHTLDVDATYRLKFNMAGTLKLNNVTVESDYFEANTWDSWDFLFNCDVEFTNVIFNREMALEKNAVLTGVTINNSSTDDSYAIWIPATQKTVKMDNVTINAAGTGKRGIKIDEQYVDIDNIGVVDLTVNNSTFNTYKKSAILVKSKAGANIVASNNNIENVNADTENLVWVDSDASASYPKVKVTIDGEPVAPYLEDAGTGVACIGNSYYLTISDALSAAKDGDTITLLKDDAVITGFTANKSVTIDLNGHKGICANNDRAMVINGATLTYQNGTIDLTGAVDNEAFFETNAHGNTAGHLVFKDMTIKGDGYNSGYAVFYVQYTGSSLLLDNVNVDLKHNAGTSSGFIKSEGSANNKVTIKNSTIALDDTYRGMVSVDVDIDKNTTITAKNSPKTFFRNVVGTINGDITVDNYEFAVENDADGLLTFGADANINFSNCTGRNILLKNGAKALFVDGAKANFDVTDYVAAGLAWDAKDNTVKTLSAVLENNKELTDKEITTIIEDVKVENNDQATEMVNAIKAIDKDVQKEITPEKVEEVINAQGTTTDTDTSAAFSMDNAIIATVEEKTETDDVNVVLKSGNNKVYNVTATENNAVVNETSTPVLIKIKTDATITKVLHEHNGVVKELPFTLANGYVMFTMNEFSNVALVSAIPVSDGQAKLSFVPTTSDEGNAKYKLVLTGDTFDTVKNFVSGEFVTSLVGTGSTPFEYVITPENGEIDVYYDTNPDGTRKYHVNLDHFNVDTSYTTQPNGAYPNSVVIGTMTVEGYGAGSIVVSDIQMNKHDGSNENLAKDINTIAGDPAIFNIAVPTRDLKINVNFPNNVNNNAKAYQNMKVEISGGDLAAPIVRELGNNVQGVVWNNNTYSITEKLTYDRSYTVTVSGEGYRTARYTVTMTDNKTLNFWNNVKKQAEVVEVGSDPLKAKNVTFLAGELVRDNQINIYDLSAVVSYFGRTNDVSTASQYAKYDLNRDGKIDSKDIAYVLVSWGK